MVIPTTTERISIIGTRFAKTARKPTPKNDRARTPEIVPVLLYVEASTAGVGRIPNARARIYARDQGGRFNRPAIKSEFSEAIKKLEAVFLLN